jgi:RNA-directed DNA polymerase
MGRVHKLKRVGHEKYSLFIKILKDIKPLPSYRDVKIAVSAVESLEVSFIKGNNDKNWYERKYDLAIYKLIILGRSGAFKKLVADLRKRLQGIKPHGR